MVIAYLRITAGRQHLEIQKDEIGQFASGKSLSVDKWLMEVVDGKRKEKDSALIRVVERMNAGDTVIITDITRFGRTLSEVMDLMGRCMTKGVHIYSISDRYMLDDSLKMSVIADTCKLIAEIEHNLMSVRTREALSHKKDKGLKLGRPKGSAAKQSLLDENKEEVMDMLERGDSIATICKHFNVSRNTYYEFKRNFGL